MSSARVRRGLPRRPGEEPWPLVESIGTIPPESEASAPIDSKPKESSTPSSPTPATTLRQGLPRSSGGDPWPPLHETEVTASTTEDTQPASAPSDAGVADSEPKAAQPAARKTFAAAPPEGLRRGLPRSSGGEKWPDAVPETAPAPEPTPVPEKPSAPVKKPAAATAKPQPKPQEKKKEVTQQQQQPEPEEKKDHSRLWKLLGKTAIGVLAFIGALTLIALCFRWVLSFGPMHSFITRYPGAAPLPEHAPVGMPAWLNWQHFLNVFFMVLIVRTGLQIRHETKPPAYWKPRFGDGKKVSLTIWLHQTLDVLWLVNGLIFFILLFSTGQWMRIVPTSWDVFPNALSAGLQYLALDWPTENGWVHFNALQQLAYFTTVFIAAPLAIITGIRMSNFWSNDWKRLSSAYPIEVARKIHFPVMVYFVIFVIIHVVLVFITGGLRNLNHMYAAQGDSDPAVYAHNWWGFVFFAISLVVIGGAMAAMRPVFVAPIAGTMGEVTAR
ncbi:cytochrome b/b6 domain-containing protein [Corynebacterium sp. 3HC-13]|uniref:cytochrome b/b6 domain-containing protein n=1 Tax=Corynebacterium poyangense TaxID=2684405 RepID=UPI001CC9F1C1|nr:cytochrome b/b6 domain-containing protein [Corynebacterium poyangense]MBZ8176505.1 cytochrome b/b6 domain-containing protein [Corynebacterium poyangense]